MTCGGYRPRPLHLKETGVHDERPVTMTNPWKSIDE
jgi:hypothetical protein